MAYTVKHEDIYHLLWDLKEIIDKQNSAIDNLETKIQNFIDYDDFKGANAVASKAYMSEVHLNLLESIKAANQSLMDSLLRYKVRYYEIESVSDDSGLSTSFVLSEEYMTQFAETLGVKLGEVATATDNTATSISNVVSRGNISGYTLPSMAGLTTQSENLSSSIVTLTETVAEHESSTVTDISNNAEAMISYIEALIAAIEADGGYSNSYVPGSFTNTDAGAALVSATNQLNEAHNQNADYYNQVWNVEGQIRENAAAREEMGVWQIVGGAAMIVGGVVCIVCSWGAATPLVVAGWGLGLATIGFGVADGIEGGHNTALGYDGNLDATAFNAVKNGLFQGNEKAYQATEGVVAFAASAMCPVASMEKAGTLCAKHTAIAVGKLAVSTGAGYGGSAIAAQFTDNQTIIMLSGMGAATLTGFTMNGVNKAVVNKKFEAEFLQRATASGLSQVDAEACFQALKSGDYKTVASYMDVSSPRDGAVFWSGNIDNAMAYADSIGGTIMEQTPGGNVFNNWDTMNDYYSGRMWGTGGPTDAKPLWGALSEEYANHVTGDVTYVHNLSPDGTPYYGRVWLDIEKPALNIRQANGLVGTITEVIK